MLQGRRRFLSKLAQPQDIERLRPFGRGDDCVRLHLPGALPAWAASLPHTAVLEISNATARNAFSGKMMAEFADAISELEAQSPSLSSVVLRGADGHFCSGADIRVAKAHLSSLDGGSLMSRVMTSSLTRLRNLPLISVALIEGAAIGGGAELSTACDFRLFGLDAKVQFVHANMGICPAWGGAARLVKLVGRQQALRLLARTEAISADRALAMGFADDVATDEMDMDATARAFLAPMAAKHPHVVRSLKRVVSNADDIALSKMLDAEHAVFQELWGGPANLEALSRSNIKAPKKE
ncbi:hypothetical protein SPRG_12932 [Saprolegnia parasitica CBS 223.65]|uniref:Ethylmalonyl-CoA decarboxylase n=1 Tax=Saprolegnia parasitica (strain CBS 223.65) TaxID=695850 RepID=A0A067C3N0_SAPPC|nr:hypothetical protein SPRG_12932 [Saprolegnia parasitica CBS 223.65]KDO21151.1 hypothetical protein SPRG_12932 [Saprolegnia parasitica CBS 223.65]|eukprot:XP_012208150.1 hypothetical protein SPRG_12932 [Saprolegnia parasitica CBS 223.65]